MSTIKLLTGDNYLHGTIQESGNNSNGNYIKFTDGTMICYNRETITTSINSSYGSLYKSDSIILSDFPVEFIDIPSVSIYCDGSYSAFVVNWLPSTKSNVGEQILVRINNTVSNVKFNIGYIAIGKWK